MSYNDFNTRQGEKGNTGFKDLIANKRGVPRMGILTPVGAEIPDITTALDIQTWIDKTKLDKADRWWVLPAYDKFEDQSTDDVYDDTYLGGSRFVEGGKRIYTVMIDANKALALKLRGFNTGQTYGYFEIDESSSIAGKTPDNVKFVGCQVIVRVGNQKPAAQGEKEMVPITFTYVDSTEWNDNGAVIEPIMKESDEWNPLTELDGVYDVDLAQVGTATTDEITVSVYRDSIDTDNALADVTGLVLADFVAKDSSGNVVTIDSATDNSDGTYTLTSSSSFEASGTIDLVECANISLTSIAIESTGAATITI